MDRLKETDSQGRIYCAVTGAVLVTIVLSIIIAACDDTPTEPTPRPQVRYRIVLEACPPVDTLTMGSHIPCADTRVEQSVDDGPWEESFSYRNKRMHVRTSGGEEIRVFLGGVPNTGGETALAEWNSRRLIIVDVLGTWTVRVTADNPFGRSISPGVERFEVVE